MNTVIASEAADLSRKVYTKVASSGNFHGLTYPFDIGGKGPPELLAASRETLRSRILWVPMRKVILRIPKHTMFQCRDSDSGLGMFRLLLFCIDTMRCRTWGFALLIWPGEQSSGFRFLKRRYWRNLPYNAGYEG
jgi:hypothetical protein